MSAYDTPYGPVLPKPGLFSKMGIPLPSITGGASGPAVSGTNGVTQFGNVTQNGGLGIWGFMSVAVVAVAIVIYMRR